MKILKKIFIAIIILLLLVVISFFLPKTYHIERNTMIKGDKALIFDLTSNLGKWDLWAPWKAMDTAGVYEIVGTDGKVAPGRFTSLA